MQTSCKLVGDRPRRARSPEQTRTHISAKTGNQCQNRPRTPTGSQTHRQLLHGRAGVERSRSRLKARCRLPAGCLRTLSRTRPLVRACISRGSACLSRCHGRLVPPHPPLSCSHLLLRPLDGLVLVRQQVVLLCDGLRPSRAACVREEDESSHTECSPADAGSRAHITHIFMCTGMRAHLQHRTARWCTKRKLECKDGILARARNVTRPA